MRRNNEIYQQQCLTLGLSIVFKFQHLHKKRSILAVGYSLSIFAFVAWMFISGEILKIKIIFQKFRNLVSVSYQYISGANRIQWSDMTKTLQKNADPAKPCSAVQGKLHLLFVFCLISFTSISHAVVIQLQVLYLRNLDRIW